MSFMKYMIGIEMNKHKSDDKIIASIESEVGFSLPEGYKQFLKEVNGGEGFFGGKNYAIIWPGEDLKRYNHEYQTAKYLEGMLLFGSDGGGEAFAFDGKNNMLIVRVPFVGMERDLAIPFAKTFEEFITLLCEKKLYESS